MAKKLNEHETNKDIELKNKSKSINAFTASTTRILYHVK